MTPPIKLAIPGTQNTWGWSARFCKSYWTTMMCPMKQPDVLSLVWIKLVRILSSTAMKAVAMNPSRRLHHRRRWLKGVDSRLRQTMRCRSPKTAWPERCKIRRIRHPFHQWNYGWRTYCTNRANGTLLTIIKKLKTRLTPTQDKGKG